MWVAMEFIRSQCGVDPCPGTGRVSTRDERALERGGKLGSNRLDGCCGQRRMLSMKVMLDVGFSMLDTVLLVD